MSQNRQILLKSCVVVCGPVAQYNSTTPSPRPDLGLLLRRITMRAFIIIDHTARSEEFLREPARSAWSSLRLSA